MSERRMFAKSIVMSDAFLDMSKSAQNLYFMLGMTADDDGFVNAPKSVMRLCSASAGDLELLIVKKFVIAFPSGIIAIKHWRINNSIRGDRYKQTNYKEEMETLELDENDAYKQVVTSTDDAGYRGQGNADTSSLDAGNHDAPNADTNSDDAGNARIGKVRLGKDNNNTHRFDEFWALYPKKVEKKKALAAFLKLDPDDQLFETIIKAVKEQSKSDQWERGFIPNPTTWINGERWNDNLPKAKPNPKLSRYMTRDTEADETFGTDYLKEVSRC